ncbi:MAG: NAD-binding protein [Candidatus Norongarragalinales archaeon]
MYIVIAGAGQIGRHLANILAEEDNDVVVIEKNPEKCKEIKDLNATLLNADATNPKALDEAEVKNADAFIAVTEHDETNLLACTSAKKKGAKLVVARLSNTYYDVDFLKSLGINITIYPEIAAASYIAELVTKPDVLDLSFIGRGLAEMLEIELPKNASVAGKKLGSLKLPEGTTIVGKIEKEKLVILRPDDVLEGGKRFVIVGGLDKIKKLKEFLGAV